MLILNHCLLLLSLVPPALGYPFFPPTCYTKVLNMARELTQMAADLKSDPETSYCMSHMPELHLDVHNACVMQKMRTYMDLVEGLRRRRCAYTREVRKLWATLRQLYIIMSERCHGICSQSMSCNRLTRLVCQTRLRCGKVGFSIIKDLVFTISDCALLER